MIDLTQIKYPPNIPEALRNFPVLLKDWTSAQFKTWEEIGIISGFPEMAYKFNMSVKYLEMASEIRNRKGIDKSAAAARTRWFEYCQYFKKWGPTTNYKELYESILPFYVEDTLYHPEVWLYQKHILDLPSKLIFDQAVKVYNIVINNTSFVVGKPIITQHDLLGLGYAFGELGYLDEAETCFLLLIKLLERWGDGDGCFKNMLWDVDFNREETILTEWADHSRRQMSLFDLARFLLSSYLGLTKIYKKQGKYNLVEETVLWAQTLWHNKALIGVDKQRDSNHALIHYGVGRNRIMELTAELIQCYREMRCFELMDFHINLLHWYTKTIYENRRPEFEYATRHAEFATEPSLIALFILDRVYKRS